MGHVIRADVCNSGRFYVAFRNHAIKHVGDSLRTSEINYQKIEVQIFYGDVESYNHNNNNRVREIDKWENRRKLPFFSRTIVINFDFLGTIM